jgi:bifunctional non-homologous end joining protein LigD
MPLGRARVPFSHSDWIYEIKWNGFRALAYVEGGVCRLVSRNGNTFKSFPDLCAAIPEELRAGAAILDGEIVCLDSDGKSQVEELLFRRGEARFQAFDLLWCEGADLRYSPLIERKARLRAITPECGTWLLYSSHVERNGEEFFTLACEHDLEGIVAKHRFSPYIPDSRPSWLKICKTDYSQWIGREELFERERAGILILTCGTTVFLRVRRRSHDHSHW